MGTRANLADYIDGRSELTIGARPPTMLPAAQPVRARRRSVSLIPAVQRWRYWWVFGLIAAAALVVAVPLFLIASNVRWVINSERLYSYGFDTYDIVERTGIERDELLSAARQIREYFNDDSELIAIDVVHRGVRVPNLYNEREVLHMRDVKGLVRGVYRVQLYAGAYLLAFAIVGLAFGGRRFLIRLVRSLGLGGLATLALVALTAVGVLVGFEGLFLLFHYVSFSNDLWILDPSRDYLIMMFPEPFFFDATMAIVGLTIVEAALLAVLSLALVRWRPRPAWRWTPRRRA